MSQPLSAPATSDPVALYLEARNYVDVEIIRMTPRRRDPARKMAAVCAFNEQLGDPQRTFRSVQVAGTSGKGSTAHYLARILHAAGHTTGLHVSPYLQVATEKTWVNGRYAGAEEFHAGYRAVRPVAQAWRYREDCPASVHGMTSLALSNVVFRDRDVEWAVMETGVGGRHDLVQGLDRPLAVITDIGLDHIRTLGESLPQIAWHKAGIMRGAELALAVYDPRVWPVFEAEARATGCRLEPIYPERTATAHATEAGTLLLLDLPRLGKVEVPSPGTGFRPRNMAVAARAADALAHMGLRIAPEHVRVGLTGDEMPGRVETVQCTPRVILDGAHNPQKMAAMLASLPPHRTGRRIFVLAATGERHAAEIAGSLPAPDAVILTRPLLFGKSVTPPHELADRLAGWCPRVVTCPSPRQALTAALDMARPEDLVLVTGSLYLVGQARDYWYPWRDVLRQRTSYPILTS